MQVATRSTQFASRIPSYTLLVTLLLAAFTCSAEPTNALAYPLSTPSLPDAGPSLLRVLGALALVIGIFLGGAWFFRNGRQLAFRHGRAPRLNILESRSLGGRQALYVVAYDQERFLLGSTPAGISLLSQLPSASENESQPQSQSAPGLSFAQALTQVLKGQTPKSGGRQ